MQLQVRFTDAAGTPSTGYVMARPADWWQGAGVIVTPAIVSAVLDASGVAVLDLADGPEYLVSDRITGLPPSPWLPYTGEWPTPHGEAL